jgi:hypothetical protein
MLRTARSHTPEGCLTLRFDPARFPAKPAACYRASWQLPGPDLPRQATTSLSLKSRSIYSSPSNSLGALRIVVELRNGDPVSELSQTVEAATSGVVVERGV